MTRLEAFLLGAFGGITCLAITAVLAAIHHTIEARRG